MLNGQHNNGTFVVILKIFCSAVLQIYKKKLNDERHLEVERISNNYTVIPPYE